MKKMGLISIICILIDQMTKLIITSNFKLNESISLIDNFFSLTYVRNEGAAWSIFSGNRLFLILIGVLSVILIYHFLIKNKSLKKIEIFIYGILLGGIVGNLIDRILLGYVIDFLDFLILGYNFPVFNLADTFIVVSVFLIIINMVRGEVHEISRKC